MGYDPIPLTNEMIGKEDILEKYRSHRKKLSQMQEQLTVMEEEIIEELKEVRKELYEKHLRKEALEMFIHDNLKGLDINSFNKNKK